MINPEICKNCKHLWQFSFVNEHILDFSCVSTQYSGLFGTHYIQVQLLFDSAQKFIENKDIFLSANVHEREYIYNGNDEYVIVLKVRDVSEELKDACKNIIILFGDCPFALEQKLFELNSK